MGSLNSHTSHVEIKATCELCEKKIKKKNETKEKNDEKKPILYY